MVAIGCSAEERRVAKPVAAAACRDLRCLEAYEGQLVDVEGQFAFPRNPELKGQHHYMLALADATRVVLPRPRDEALLMKLSHANDGERLIVRGRIFVRDIPERYGIVERTSAPYLLDVADVFVLIR
jgi:hypothetical protein